MTDSIQVIDWLLDSDLLLVRERRLVMIDLPQVVDVIATRRGTGS
ncbi:MAG: hypothetical protein WA794_13875 [Trebonia sp.]